MSTASDDPAAASNGFRSVRRKRRISCDAGAPGLGSNLAGPPANPRGELVPDYSAAAEKPLLKWLTDGQIGYIVAIQPIWLHGVRGLDAT